MTINDLKIRFSLVNQRKISGGITCDHLRITDNGSRQLTVSGDVNITIKVLDLTTTGAPRIHSLANFTQNTIQNKLKGDGGLVRDNYLHEYDTHKNAFNNQFEFYTLHYALTYIVRVEIVKSLHQLHDNDFVLAVVDSIGYGSAGKKEITGGLTGGAGNPATVSYQYWSAYPNIGAHEFFHTLGLNDLYNKNQVKSLMYNVGGHNRTEISQDERTKMNTYIMFELDKMYAGSYSNGSLNTVNKLKIFLNSPANGIKYNKAKLR